ncbi:cationic amino acid transporter 2 [Copidosoma floridanum]|uniref:cationic amino acid transporter 2 n=1 Tax=Copidosoma floridanum TaxID=29053 RepID=UPI000C6F44B5|nr:cationic amino acid transporter 2 [Copidosoma floridanum]
MDVNWDKALNRLRTMRLQGLYRATTRKKCIDEQSDSSLVRCFSALDLTALGIGSSLGVGVYVLVGNVAKTMTGPAVIISFAIAAVVSMIAGLCYAEFAARVPKAGSAYVYSYVTIGEFMAFVIGWILILEYIIGSASVVRGLSKYVDALFNNSMSLLFQAAAPMNISHFSQYPDFFAFGVTLVFSGALACGAKESSTANNIFTLVNLSVVLFVIVSGAIKADFKNWKIKPNCQTEICRKEKGEGGFMPFGIAGVISGAATCFYGFIGFDCVATTSEEAKNPKRDIPIAIIASLTVVFLAYFSISTILTTVLPYYDQDTDAPFPYMFKVIGWDWARYVVTAGAICALCASLMGSMYPLPRIIYAMASDGLIFKSMGKIHSRFHTPVIGTLSSGLLTGILAAIFDLDELIGLMNIGVFITYSIVAACVVILRYEESNSFEKKQDIESYSLLSVMSQLVNFKRLNYSTKLTSKIVTYLVPVYFVICFGVSLLYSTYDDEIKHGNLLFVIPLTVLVFFLVSILFFIYLQPKCDRHLSFKVPFVPFLPAISILFNVYLMVNIKMRTWIEFFVWMAAGFCIYFLYGIWNSNMNTAKKTEKDNLKNGDLPKF